MWPDSSLDKNAQLFHTNLYNLRRFFKQAGLPDNMVAYSGRKYRLRQNSCATDREQFDQLLHKAKNRDAPPRNMEAWLTEAVELYRGDYLAGMDYAWLIFQRESYELAYSQALKQLGRFYMDVGEYSQSIHYLHLLMKNDPFAEDVCRMLMTAYANIGNPAMVKDIYHDLMQSLDSELAILPSPETRDLYNQLSAPRTQ